MFFKKLKNLDAKSYLIYRPSREKKIHLSGNYVCDFSNDCVDKGNLDETH